MSNTAPLSEGASRSRPPCPSSTMRRVSARPMPHPDSFVENPAEKIFRRSSRGTPGPSSATRTRTPPPGTGSTPTDDAAAPPRERVDRVLHERLRWPTRAARDRRPPWRPARRVEPDRDRMGERRHARGEVRHDVPGDLDDIHRVTAGRPADALEAVRHALEPLDVALHVRQRLRDHRIVALAQQLDPAVHARERRAELVRGLARHAGEDALAVGGALRAQHHDAGEDQHAEHRRPSGAGSPACPDERRVADVNRDEAARHRRVLGVERVGVRVHVRRRACRRTAGWPRPARRRARP